MKTLDYSITTGQQAKITKKIKANKQGFVEEQTRILENVAKLGKTNPNRGLALTYRAIAKKESNINGRTVVPFTYFMRGNEDVVVTMDVPKDGRNIHHRSPTIRMNDKEKPIIGYRRAQYDNLSETVISILEKTLPHAVEPYTYNDISMIVSYLFNLSGKNRLSDIEAEIYDTGNDHRYIKESIEKARELCTAEENQKWFVFSCYLLCSEMMIEPEMANKILHTLEENHLIYHAQVTLTEKRKGKTKEHLIDVMHMNFVADEKERDERFLHYKKEEDSNEHIPAELANDDIEKVIVTDKQVADVIDIAQRSFDPTAFNGKIEAKIERTLESESSNIPVKRAELNTEIKQNISDYARRANDAITIVVNSVNKELEQMQRSGVEYINQLGRLVENQQQQINHYENRIAILEAELKEMTKKYDAAQKKAELIKTAATANVESAKGEVLKWKDKYHSKKRESKATDEFLKNYMIEVQDELADMQVFLNTKISAFSNSKPYQLNDPQYTRKFRVETSKCISNVINRFTNYSEDKAVPNAIK